METGIETERELQREIEQLIERGDQTDQTELREELVVVKKKGGGGHGPGKCVVTDGNISPAFRHMMPL